MAFISSSGGLKFCPVCGKRVLAEGDLINEHKNKYEKLCYGSFMPYRDINPFKDKKKKSKNTWGQASSAAPILYGTGPEDDDDAEDNNVEEYIGNEADSWINDMLDAEFAIQSNPGAIEG